MSASSVGPSLPDAPWYCSAEMLINNLYPRALRSLISATGKHCQGLSIAAKEARNQQKIGGRMLKKLLRLDNTYHTNRHVSLLSIEIFMKELNGELSAQVSGPQRYDIGSEEGSDMGIEEFETEDEEHLAAADMKEVEAVSLCQTPSPLEFDLESMDGVTTTPVPEKEEVIVANVATSNHFAALEEVATEKESAAEEELVMVQKKVEEMLADVPALSDYKERFEAAQPGVNTEEIMDKMLGMVARLPMTDLADVPKLPFEIPGDGICAKTALPTQPTPMKAELLLGGNGMVFDKGMTIVEKMRQKIAEIHNAG